MDFPSVAMQPQSIDAGVGDSDLRDLFADEVRRKWSLPELVLALDLLRGTALRASWLAGLAAKPTLSTAEFRRFSREVSYDFDRARMATPPLNSGLRAVPAGLPDSSLRRATRLLQCC
jgi:hypothetical protein